MSNIGKSASMLAWMMASGLSPEIVSKPKQEEKKRYCLECGNEREHNNSFCSANCHKVFFDSIKKSVKTVK